MNSSQRQAVTIVISAIGLGCALLAVLGSRVLDEYLPADLTMGLMIGTLFGHVALAGAWSALGPLSLWKRLLLSLAWIAALVAAFGIPVALVNEGPIALILLVLTSLLCGQWVLVQLPLWYVVLVRGWRLRDRQESAKLPDVNLRHFGIWEFVILLGLLGLLYGVAKAAQYFEPKIYGDTREGAIQIYWAVVVAVCTMPLVVSAFLPRGAAIASTAIVALVMGVTLALAPIVKQFDGSIGGPDLAIALSVTNATAVVWVLAVVVGVRLCGFGLGAAVRAPALARRRWVPRFGLRTLLVTMTVLGIGLGYVGMLLQRVRHQRHIVSLIEAAGGEVRYNWQFGMGAELEATYEDSVEYESNEFSETSDGRNKHTRRDIEGELISEEIETPPGPWFVRKLLGDDIFAHVGSVSFVDDRRTLRAFDPNLLLELPQLKAVGLRDQQVTDEWIACIARIPHLRAVNLWGDDSSTATGTGVAQLRNAKELWHLGLHGEWVRDETVAGIASLTQLRSLQIMEGPNLTSAVFQHLGGLAEIRELTIRRAPQLDDEGAESLRRLTKLRRLSILGTSTGDATLAHLTGLSQLEAIDFSVTNVGDPGMEFLADLPNLKRVRIAGTHNVGDAGLESLSRLPQLRYLDIDGRRITDASMPTLGRMTQLKTLSLWGTSVTDCGVMQLGTLKNLRDLSLGETPVTNHGGEALIDTLPRKCRIYYEATRPYYPAPTTGN